MQRYQPPHLRQRDVLHSGQPLHRDASSSLPSMSLGDTPRQTSRRWGPNGSPGPALQSPASDLRPMRSGMPGRKGERDVDDMDMMQSVSRSGGDGAEGDALKDYATQEKYRNYISDRIDKHYAAFSRSRDEGPPSDAQEELHSLGSIVLLLRKLREGVIASHRIDNFAIDVFETSARIAILARNLPQSLSSLSGLVPGLYLAVDRARKGKFKLEDHSPSDIDGVTGRLSHLIVDPSTSTTTAQSSLPISDDRLLFTSLYLLYLLVQSDSPATFHSSLISLTGPASTSINQPFAVSQPSRVSHTPEGYRFVSPSNLSFPLRAKRALAEETFDPLLYFHLLSESSASSSYERCVLSWAEEKVRRKAWDVIKKAYIDCRSDWGCVWMGLKEAEMATWVTAQGGRIEGDRVKWR